MKIFALNRIFKPLLTKHIPGEKRVYKNILGKTIKTIERTEERIENLEPKKLSKFLDNLDGLGIDKSITGFLDKITATRKPINAVSFMVKDKNGNIERVNVSIKSGNAIMRYRSSFNKEGELEEATTTVK